MRGCELMNGPQNSKQPPPRVIVAEDHPRMMQRICEIVATCCDVIETVHDGESCVRVAMKLVPDLVILDIAMPRMDGIQVARELSRLLASCKIIFLTIQPETAFVKIAEGIGAGYVLKQKMYSDLPLAIDHVRKGERFISEFRSTANE